MGTFKSNHGWSPFKIKLVNWRESLPTICQRAGLVDQQGFGADETAAGAATVEEADTVDNIVVFRVLAVPQQCGADGTFGQSERSGFFIGMSDACGGFLPALLRLARVCAGGRVWGMFGSCLICPV